MSVEGGKDVAKELISNINSCMGNDVKVFIADEAQRMSDAAQDVLLHDTEHLPEKVFLIMCTTDITRINKTLRSRAVKYYLPRISHSVMTSFVLSNLHNRCLRFQSLPMVAELISTISEHKPREALSIIDALGYNRDVSLTELNSVLQMPDVSEFKALLSTFNGSITEGISKIFDMDITSQTQHQLCCYIVGVLKFMNGLPVYQYDVGTDLVQDVDARILTEFLYYVSDLQTFDKIKLLSAYMLAHPQGSQIANHTSDKIGSELIYMSKHTSASNNVEAVNTPLSRKRPTADDLLRNSSIH
jgi:DNA polymerase III gamma/tau subunit